MNNVIIKMLNIESSTLDMYLEDIVIPDLNNISKIIPDLIDYTKLINICLNVLPDVHSSQILESTISNIKVLIENILFEKYRIGDDTLVWDVLESSSLEHSHDDYTLYLKMTQLINEYVTMYDKRYISKYDYVRIPIQWLDVNDRTLLKILNVYVE